MQRNIRKIIYGTQQKKIVVAGGAGLIGLHIVDKLLKEDVVEVLIYDNFLQGSPENLTEVPQDARVKI